MLLLRIGMLVRIGVPQRSVGWIRRARRFSGSARLIGLAILPAVAWLQTPVAWKGVLASLGLLLLLIVMIRHAVDEAHGTTRHDDDPSRMSPG